MSLFSKTKIAARARTLVFRDNELLNDFEDVEEEAPARGGGACAVDPALYSMLKDLRKKLSKKLEVPPYVIFQDPSLEAMATI